MEIWFVFSNIIVFFVTICSCEKSSNKTVIKDYFNIYLSCSSVTCNLLRISYCFTCWFDLHICFSVLWLIPKLCFALKIKKIVVLYSLFNIDGDNSPPPCCEQVSKLAYIILSSLFDSGADSPPSPCCDYVGSNNGEKEEDH